MAEGSSMPSFTGMGTRSISLRSSSFSSSRTTMFRNSWDRENKRKMPISDSVGFKNSLYVAIDGWDT